MVGNRRKSQQLRTDPLLCSGHSSNLKEEADDEGYLKPADASDLRHALSHVKVKEEIADDHSKPILDGCKMVHVRQRRPVGRGHRGKYGNDSRYAYIMSIVHQLKLSPNSLLSGAEGRLFHNVFKHLIDAIVSSQTSGSDEGTIQMDIGLDGCNSLVPLISRECLLKKILTILLGMACRRHYNPPSESEVVYYRELKRHIRCVIAYHEANGKSEDVRWAYSKDPAGYHSLSCSQTISAVEELTELTGSLAELIPQFQELSQNNVSAPDISMHVRMDLKSLPEPNWSVEKTSAFYYSKLILVLHDLKCSGLVGLSPKSNEKKSINTLLDYVTSTNLHVKKECEMCDPLCVCEPVGATTRKRGRDILMDNDDDDDFYPIGPVMHTADFFDGKLDEYMKQLRKTCLRLMKDIMGKLERVGYPFTLFHRDDNNIMLEWLKKVKFSRLSHSANDVHQSVLLARYAASLVQGISSCVEDACAELTDILRRRQHYYEFAPQALLVLLLSDCGAFRKTGKMAKLQDGEAQTQSSDCSSPCQCSATLTCHDGAESYDNGVKCGDSNNTDSVKILTGILQVLKHIGTSDALGPPSPSEVIILDQILEHVCLCIDGFLCAKAYQKERELRRTPCHKVASELSRIRNNNGVPKYFYPGCVYGVEGMSERLKQLQEGFNLVIEALQKVEII